MILTLVLAVLFAGAKGMREMEPTFRIRAVVFGLLNVVLGLAAAWAALGLAPPIKRLLGVLLLCPTFETLFWYGMGSPGWDTYWNINVCMLLQVAITFGSLLVVRSCGFRIVQAQSELESQGGIRT
jgi:hypothetical protein